EGRLSMHWQPLNVGALIEDAAAQAAARFTDKRVELRIEATEEARQAVLTADPDRLGQVLTNLLDNAVRHTPQGGRVQLGAPRPGTAPTAGRASGSPLSTPSSTPTAVP